MVKVQAQGLAAYFLQTSDKKLSTGMDWFFAKTCEKKNCVTFLLSLSNQPISTEAVRELSKIKRFLKISFITTV
jgi:hypothetical protein